MTKNTPQASIDFTLEWKSHAAQHSDVHHVQKVDFSRDIFPEGFSDKVAMLEIGESVSETYKSEALLGEAFFTNQVVTFPSKDFDTEFKGESCPPMLYRFYPTAIAWSGLGSYEADYTPFRLISMNEDNMIADRNHPLSKYYLTLTATKIAESTSASNDQGRKNNIVSLVTSRGPGMQIPFEFGETVFFDHYPYRRLDETSDIAFYEEPRFTQYIDSNASAEIGKLYTRLLPKYSKVLDLMSSWVSHLEDDFETGLLVGLGLNQQELNENPRLDTYEVQDLNTHYILPYENNSFDDAICTLSIEYLVDPIQVMKEVARVVKPSGKFIVTFSECCFPTKAITLWPQLHPFERVQLVLEYFRQTEDFTDLNTYSKRGLLRPKDNKYSGQKRFSDPVYAVWGTVS